jgi:hypothetical protein
MLATILMCLQFITFIAGACCLFREGQRMVFSGDCLFVLCLTFGGFFQIFFPKGSIFIACFYFVAAAIIALFAFDSYKKMKRETGKGLVSRK